MSQKTSRMTLPEAISVWMQGRPLFGDVRQMVLDALLINSARSRDGQ